MLIYKSGVVYVTQSAKEDIVLFNGEKEYFVFAGGSYEIGYHELGSYSLVSNLWKGETFPISETDYKLAFS